jgi:hypothetical protein
MDRHVFFGRKTLHFVSSQTRPDVPVQISDVVSRLIVPVILEFQTGSPAPGQMFAQAVSPAAAAEKSQAVKFLEEIRFEDRVNQG